MGRSTEGTRFRRDVVATLRLARSTLMIGLDDWDVRSTVYLQPHEREDQREYRRPRRPEEYPEVQPQELSRLYDRLQRTIDALRVLQGRVHRRYRTALAAQQRDGLGN